MPTHAVDATPPGAGRRCTSVSISRYLGGRIRFELDGDELALDAEHVGVLDLGRPFHATCSDVDTIWVVIPRHRMPASARSSSWARFHRDSPRGRVLRSAVMSAWLRLPDAQASDAPAMAHEIVDAAGSALGRGDFTPSDSALATAMREFVLTRLDDLELDARGARRPPTRDYDPDSSRKIDTFHHWAARRPEARRCNGCQTRKPPANRGFSSVAPTGIDPVTFRFSVERSTN